MQNIETNYSDWIGNSETRHAILTPYPMAALAATLDRKSPAFNAGDVIPPLWHWLYFLETTRQSRLAADGHAEKGEFLPPINLPRRMWAGSRIEFVNDLRIGDEATRLSTINGIDLKHGRSGKLAFVTVAHTITTAVGVALTEQHDIVYREAARPDAAEAPAQMAPATADFSKTIQADPVLLFRYSALTFNGHRIHYDREFAHSSEGYPGLVVHGPLLATLMLELLVTSLPGVQLRQFEFKALRPVFDLDSFTVCCKAPEGDGTARVWISNQSGALCMQGSALLKER